MRTKLFLLLSLIESLAAPLRATQESPKVSKYETIIESGPHKIEECPYKSIRVNTTRSSYSEDLFDAVTMRFIPDKAIKEAGYRWDNNAKASSFLIGLFGTLGGIVVDPLIRVGAGLVLLPTVTGEAIVEAHHDYKRKHRVKHLLGFLLANPKLIPDFIKSNFSNQSSIADCSEYIDSTKEVLERLAQSIATERPDLVSKKKWDHLQRYLTIGSIRKISTPTAEWVNPECLCKGNKNLMKHYKHNKELIQQAHATVKYWAREDTGAGTTFIDFINE